jgi:predicted dinucleotide-binding enzyme
MKKTILKVGVLGSGDVAKTLASGFVKHGYDVMIGSRDVKKLDEWKAKNPSGKTGTFEEAAIHGEVVVLAVKGTVAVEALRLAGAKNLSGKTIIDANNPIADAAPVNGVLPYFTSTNDSLLEQLQREFPEAHLVKAFNSVGASYMINPQFADGPPTMFICGNNTDAKETVRGIVEQFGWECADMGTMEAARAIEPLCILWCLPGFRSNDWGPRAFKMLK